tara:strand:+ start:717 stop:992 length:276 start_codon:yes stop_codon:yes gene_type:complete
MDNQDEIIVGYCDMCRSYEKENYGEVLSQMNQKHFNACEISNCLHPVFYIADNTEKTMIPYPIDHIKKMMYDDPELSLDDFEMESSTEQTE